MSTWQSIRSMVRRRINGLHDICLAPPSQPAAQKNYTPQVKMFCNKKKKPTLQTSVEEKNIIKYNYNYEQWQRQTAQGRSETNGD